MTYGVVRWVGSICILVLLAACGDDAAPPPADGGGGDGGGADAPMIGMDAPPPQCDDDTDCGDDDFCNGIERCRPGESGSGPDGCAASSMPACLAGQVCDEDAETCTTDCEVTPDADEDGHRAEECGGDDCADEDGDRFPGHP